MKVIYHTNSCYTFYHFRLPLMRAALAEGLEVVAVGPRDHYATKLENEGIRFIDVPMSLSGLNPLTESLVVGRLIRAFRAEKPSVVHNFSLKPVLYGSLAARAANIPTVVNTVTGLGHAFARESLLKHVIQRALRFGVTDAMWMTFQNRENLEEFQHLRIARSHRSVVISGSGVDTSRFKPLPRPARQPLTFLLLGRMMWSKGVEQFCEAARRLRSEAARLGHVPPRFVLLGGCLPGNPTGVAKEWLANPDAIPPGWLADRVAAGDIEHVPHDDDVLPHIQAADVVVLPSYYPEGVPRSLLEAMSCGKALITTDTPGCRETVEPSVNGLLVRPKDVDDLHAAMRTLLMDINTVQAMGEASRRLALRRFSDEAVVAEYLALYRRVGLRLRTQGADVEASRVPA